MKSAFKSLMVVACSSVTTLVLTTSASALTLVRTQTFNFDPGPSEIPTIWNRTATVDKYAPGGLAKVEIEVSGTATSTLTASTGETEATIRLDLSSVGAEITLNFPQTEVSSLNVIPVAPLGDPGESLEIPANSSEVFADIRGQDSSLTELTSGLGGFEGSGTFTVPVNAIGLAVITNTGGNITTSQTTEAYAQLIVRYYTGENPPTPSTPESSPLLGLFIFAGVGLVSRYLT